MNNSPPILDVYAQIGEHISRATGETFRPHHDYPRGGGCISEGVVLADGAQMFFIKLNHAARLPMFEAEIDGLQRLAATRTLRVPVPIVCGVVDSQSFLALEYLPLEDSDAPEHLAEQLIALHQHTDTHFGLARDNFIGTNEQCNTPSLDWVSFWSSCRLQPQLERAARNDLDPAILALADQLIEAMPALFTDYRPRPSLLHGDLWGGNYGYVAGEGGAPSQPVIFDPAVYFGDREADIAMTELFGGFPPRFRHAYEVAWPLDPGYGVRRQLYNLYHVLNHFNLFGGSYAAQAQRLLQRLLSEVRA